MIGWLLPVSALLGGDGWQASGVDTAVAFVGVAVVRTGGPGVDRDQTVVVRGGRIAWVGAAERARLEPPVVRIDGRGRYLLPGFADMHVHLGREGDLLTYLANGITTVRNLWGAERHLAWRERIARGRLLGPRIVTSGPIIDGSPPSVPSMLVLTDPAAARAEVRRQHAAGYDFIKVYNSLPAAGYDSIVAAARDLGLPVAGHVPFEVGLAGAIRSGQRSIEHLRGYISELVPAGAPVQPGASLRSRSLAWAHVDRSRMAAVVRATVAAGVWNVPTLMVTGELLAPPDRWDELARRPMLRYLGPGAVPDRATIPYLRDFSPDDFRASLEGMEPQRELVRLLVEAGAGVLLGTDSYLQGFAFQAELEEFERAGVEPWRILKAATADAAAFLGESGVWGEVAAGQTADLQLVEDDPLASLSALRRRAGVMVRGRWLPRAALQASLDSLARSYGGQPPGPAGSDWSASMNRRARSPAGPGDRGPAPPGTGATSSTANTGPAASSRDGNAPVHPARSVKRNTASKPQARAIAAKSTAGAPPRPAREPGVGWAPVTSYTPLSYTATTRLAGAAAVIETSDPRFISIDPSPFSTMMRRAGWASARPSPIEVACPIAEGTNTRSRGCRGPRASHSRAVPIVVTTTSPSRRTARTAATASRTGIGLMPSPPRPAPRRVDPPRDTPPDARP